MKDISTLTGRPLIVYATNFLNNPSPATNIDRNDKEGFREVLRDLDGNEMDILLHSPGGQAEAAEAIVKLIRAKKRHIRFIIPNLAQSAATMLAMAGDEILMDTDAELGPIDPQFLIPKADGTVAVAPAQAIIDQFDAIEKKVSKNPQFLPPWIPILQVYAPSLYQQARNALDLAEVLVKQWLKEYMFADEPKRKRGRLAAGVARYLSDHNKFKSHGRGLCPDDFRKIPALSVAKVRDLADMPDVQNRVQGLYHAISLTFGGTTAIKIFENTEGKALIRLQQQIAMQIPLMMRPMPPGESQLPGREGSSERQEKQGQG
ncbi:MAG: SDH family Clp fold serine proteinase [Nitrospiraceae bacterium]